LFSSVASALVGLIIGFGALAAGDLAAELNGGAEDFAVGATGLKLWRPNAIRLTKRRRAIAAVAYSFCLDLPGFWSGLVGGFVV
jgi:hypothetical protein